MQHIRLGETTAALIGIQFTTVLTANLTSRVNGATLANAGITVKIKKGGVGAAVAGGAGSFTAVDDTNAPGVREYIPSSSELVLGVSTFIFTAAGGVEPREIPVMVTPEDPYRPVTFGTAVTGTLTTGAFSTSQTETTTDAWKDALIEFLSGPNIGSVRKITGYNGSTKVITVNDALPATPTNGDKYRLITR